MAHKLTKQAALEAGDIFDKAAQTALAISKAAGIKPEIAEKFAYQCDLLSDHAAKVAGIDITKLASERTAVSENPEQIGEEKSGPKEQEGDESYMGGHFSQQENRELREKQEAGELPTGSPERQTPRPGVQAALANGQKLAALYLDINGAASRCASSDHAAVKTLGEKLAAAGLDVLSFQTRMLEGSENDERLASLTRGAAHVMPHLAGDVPPAAAEKLARMTEIFAGLAKAAQ
jgi:hypothetical protein